MRKILVVQLCRIGDILMTGPLLRGLRRAHPSAEVSLMVMDSFAATPLPSHLYDRLLVFPLGGLAGALADRQRGWEPSRDALRSFFDDAGGPFDLVVNLTHTDMSALVTSLVPARRRVGLVMRADRRLGLDSAWMTYLRASMRSRPVSAFHLVDLFAWTAGVARDASGLEITVTADDEAWAASFMRTHGLTGRPFIALQLGASSDAKRWPVERFAALADALDPSLGEIVIIGGPAERALADRCVAATARRVINGAGASTLGGLAALLRHSRLLVTNDTGPMHVAAAVGTRVLDVSSGPVSPHETGPYGAGHVVVEPVLACSPCPLDAECHHFACRATLSPDEAAAVARFAMGEGPEPVLAQSRLLVAQRIAPSGRIAFLPAREAWTADDYVRYASARVWETGLDAPASVDGGWATTVTPPAPSAEVMASLARIEAVLHNVARDAAQAAALVKDLPRTAPAKVPQVAARVHATLERLLAIGESERAVHPIVMFLRHEIDSVAATDMAGVSRGQAAAYAGASKRAEQLAEALHVVDLGRWTEDRGPSPTSSPDAPTPSSLHRRTA